MSTSLRVLVFFILNLIVFSETKAQIESDNIRVTTNHVNLGLSSVSILDNYISDLIYTGSGIRLSNVSRKRLDTENGIWVVVSDQLIDVGNAFNEPKTASMYFSNLYLGIGTQKGLKISNDFRVFIGGTVDFQYVSHQSDREVNNYFNMNVSSNLNAAFTCVYDTKIWNTDMCFYYDLRIPVLGMSFLPDLGISYYEMFQNNDMASYVYVTSLHNKQMFQHHAWIQIPMKKLFLNVGIQTESNVLQINRNHFGTKSFSIAAGVSYHFSLFGGRGRKYVSYITEAEQW